MNSLHEQFTLFSTQFHWLRPLWLLALIPMLILSILLWQQKHKAHQWQHIIAPELLPFLLDGKSITTKKSLLWGLILAWLIGTIAIAGPSWIKRPTPVEKNQNALVILLDLSLSMYSEDVKPSRMVRARLKIADILRERKDGQTALVAYAGEAHTVTPISDDSATIISLLPALQPNIMPLQGSNAEAAVERGIKLLHDAGATRGDLLLVTDGVVPAAFSTIRDLVSNKNIHLNILGVGTNQPTPISSSNGGFVRDRQGAVITTQLNSDELNTLAQQVHGRYHEISNTNSDIEYLLPKEETDEKNKPTQERDFDQWFDQGHWLVFLLLPIVLFSFRRGTVLLLICIPFMGLKPTSAYALDANPANVSSLNLSDMWLTKDQQAQRQLTQGDAKKAAELFENPDWKAAAEYRAGDYAAAAENFAKSDSAAAHYNRGNALAKGGKLEDAIKAYDEALKHDANLEDAKKNRTLVEKMLEQQKQQNKNKQDKDKQNKDKQDKDKQDQDKQDQDKQDSDKKDQDKDSQDKNSEQKDSKEKDQKDSKEQQQDDKSSQEKKDQQNGDQQQNSSSANQQAQASSAANQAANGQGSSASAANQQMAQASSQSHSEKDSANQQAAMEQNNLTEEQKQSLEQWLRRVPDDPGGLLRNKFKYQYLQTRQQKADGEFESPKNNADQRW